MSDPTPAPVPTPAPAPVPPTTLSLTQEEFDKRLQEEFGKGKRLGSEGAALAKAERERLATLEAKEAAFEKSEKERKVKEAEARGDFEKSRELIIKSAQEEERKAWEPKLTAAEERAKKLEGRFSGILRDKLMAAAGPKAYNPAQVADLLEGRRVRLNADFEPEVLDEQGQPALVGGKPMTVDQLVAGYLDANPNLVKANGAPGGAGGGRSLTSAETGAVAELEAKIKAVAEKYAMHRNSDLLTEHRALIKQLADVKAKAGK